MEKNELREQLAKESLLSVNIKMVQETATPKVCYFRLNFFY